MLFRFVILLQSGGHFARPYDSTQGVPNYVFMGFWIIIIGIGLRIAWEFRNDIFKKKD